MKIRVFLCMAIGVGAAAASVAGQSQPKNFSIDPWHINVPKPVANPVTSITERIPGRRPRSSSSRWPTVCIANRHDETGGKRAISRASRPERRAGNSVAREWLLLDSR